MNRSEFHKKIFLLLLGGITLAFFWILSPFYDAVFWSFIFAILFSPMYRFFLRKTKERASLAALITLLICLLIVIIPLAYLSLLLTKEGTVLYQFLHLHKLNIDTYFQEMLAVLPNWIVDSLNFFGVNEASNLQEKISAAIIKASHYLASRIFDIGQNIANFMVSFLLMLYLLFFLFRDGAKLAEQIKKVIPLNETQKHQLLSKFMSVIRATVKGNLVVAIVQGGLGGLIFWFLSIPNALLWGAVMILLSLLPFGAGVVWIPVAIYFFVTGSLLKSIILFAFGTFVIGLIDNILRPILVGKDTQMPDYIILISTLGGLVLFGLNGFVIGPTIAALFITSWDLFGMITNPPEIPVLEQDAVSISDEINEPDPDNSDKNQGTSD